MFPNYVGYETRLSMTTPKVSIGLPVFNGENSLRRALDSLLLQTYDDFELIISDNSSTDQTELICRAYAENFIALNYEFLETHPDYVSSVCPVKFESRGFDDRQMGDRSLDDERFDFRIRKFFGPWHANGAFYSLMRTEVIKNCEWVGEKFLGGDWAVVLYLARQGKLNRLDLGWLELGINGASNSGGFFRRYRSTPLDFFVPFWRMSQAVFSLSRGAPFASKVVLLKECLVMNMWALNLQIVGWLYRQYKSIKTTTDRVANRETRL